MIFIAHGLPLLDQNDDKSTQNMEEDLGSDVSSIEGRFEVSMQSLS